MSSGRSCAARSLVVLLAVLSVGYSHALSAQQVTAPTLDEILKHLQANLNHYDGSLPSLFCDEHLVSQVEPGLSNEHTVTDSIFRLKRVDNADHTTSLVESRDIKTMDGKPAAPQAIKAFPSMVNGAFEGGFAVVSLDQRGCMKYTLERVREKQPDEPYVVNFATELTPENKAKCLLQEKSKGRVFIDPASMGITHFEMTTPHHLIVQGNAYDAPVYGKWVVTVDYVPVVLDRETFWLPSEIKSRNVSTSQGFHVTVWSFEAAYRNYHRLEVTSHILPGSEASTR